MERVQRVGARKRVWFAVLRPVTGIVGVALPPIPPAAMQPRSGGGDAMAGPVDVDNPERRPPIPMLLSLNTPLNVGYGPKPPMFDLRRIGMGMALSTAVGGLAYKRGSLSESGWLGAVLTGTATLGFGGWTWGMTLISFFVSSSALSHYKERVKEQRTGGKFAKGTRRDLAQALANGGLGSLLALAYAILREPPLLRAIFLGVMATVTADTWATELGVLSSEKPRLITTLQPVERGTSGAVTVAGTSASAVGGLLMGLTMAAFLALERSLRPAVDDGGSLVWMAPAGLLGGLVGSLSDSWMAATVQATYRYPDGRETERPVGKDGTPHMFVRGFPWFNNDLVNLLSTLTGGAVAAAVYLLAARKKQPSL